MIRNSHNNTEAWEGVLSWGGMSVQNGCPSVSQSLGSPIGTIGL